MKTEQIDKLYRECPKAMASVEEYLGRHMNDVPVMKEAQDLKKQLGSNTKATARLFLAMGERFLYEYFDEKELYIGITPFGQEELLSTFYWRVRYKKGDNPLNEQASGNSLSCDTRQGAEVAAFVKAFEILESKLGQTGLLS
jgi:hypothetical protein